MKRVSAAFLLVAAGFAAGSVFRAPWPPPARAGGAGGGAMVAWTPDLRGDVNGDRKLDVTDAIVILNFLFRGGDPPLPLPPPRRAVLPATGQTECFSGTRGEPQTPCPGPGMDDYGQDPSFRSGTPHDFELVKLDELDSSTWVTIDHSTGLMWQHGDDGVRRNWRDALRYAEDLDTGGFDDWRLPNIMELFSLVDIGRDNPAIDKRVFAVKPLVYWSSSSCLFDTSRAWTVRFAAGTVNCLDKGGQGQSSFRFLSLAVRDVD